MSSFSNRSDLLLDPVSATAAYPRCKQHIIGKLDGLLVQESLLWEAGCMPGAAPEDLGREGRYTAASCRLCLCRGRPCAIQSLQRISVTISVHSIASPEVVAGNKRDVVSTTTNWQSSKAAVPSRYGFLYFPLTCGKVMDINEVVMRAGSSLPPFLLDYLACANGLAAISASPTSPVEPQAAASKILLFVAPPVLSPNRIFPPIRDVHK